MKKQRKKLTIDKNGYPRGKLEHSDLIHRQVAYSEIYLKDKDRYPKPFSQYKIHHKDGDKKNFMPDNLQLVSDEEHRKIHGLLPKENKDMSLDNFSDKNKHYEEISYQKNILLLYL